MSDVELHRGDCVEVMRSLGAGCVDAVVADPPYGLEFMGKEWDRLDGGFSKPGIGARQTEWPSFGGDPFAGYNPTCETCGGRARGKKKCVCAEPAWKVRGESLRELARPKPGNLGGFATGNKPSFARTLRHLPAMQEWHHRWAVEALRVLKPGGYLLAFGGTRTFHRLACALEDAGFEMRDTLCWLYGQGFPKGRGCLKPAWEPILLCRKPGRGVRPLGIDECRVSAEGLHEVTQGLSQKIYGGGEGLRKERGQYKVPSGRWPANLVLSHHPECAPLGLAEVNGGAPQRVNGRTDRRQNREQYRIGPGVEGSVRSYGAETVEAYACHPDCPLRLLDAQAGPQKSGGTPPRRPPTSAKTKHAYGDFTGEENPNGIGRSAGAVSRFFYCPKASKKDRGEGNTHPTVKPTALMEWLVKLVAREGETALDPFAGSGSTLKAAIRCGRNAIGIEQNPEYYRIAARRVRAARKAVSA